MFAARNTPSKGVAKSGWLIARQSQSTLVARRGQSTIAALENHEHRRDDAPQTHQSHQRGGYRGELAFRPIPQRPPHGEHGGRVRRSRGYQKVSPNLVLAMRLHNRDSPLTWDRWKSFRSIAGSTSLRLPVLTTQLLMKQEEARTETSLSELLKNNNWDRRMEILASKGITEEHINHWAWILSGETPDSRLERFLSTDQHKPIFMLLAILRSQETFKQRASFVSLLQYISRFYCTSPPQERPEGQPRAMGMATDPRLNMTPDRFVMLLKRLVYHSLRLWPDLLVSISRLVTAYIATIDTGSRATMSPTKQAAAPQIGYAARCRVFNHALRFFGKTALLNPLANTKHNWDAQKLLLSFSTSLERQLVLGESSYGAIRTIIIGLEKSQPEEKVAVRSRKTWPPYREEWDGLDERRRPEDDLSRSVKAGILAREAGYPETDYDRALGALGGAVLGQSPTVQTRSTQPKLWTGKLASLNIYTTWAAQVKATRNAHEAWRIFEAPRGGLKPNFQVYAEMFEKLFSHPLSDPSSAVPGNAKEVFPPYEANLTAVEKARLQPPGVTELYDRMLHSGNRPVGKCLALLIAHSHSEDMASQYLLDSPFRSSVSALRQSTLDAPSASALRGIPLPIFNAYISLLCKLHSEEYLKPGSQGLIHPDAHIRRAMTLACSRLGPNSPEGRTYKPPWHNILRALATTRTLFVSRGFANNHLETLSTVLRLFERAKDQTGMDCVLLELLSFAVGRTMTAIFTNRKYPNFEVQPNGLYRVSPAGEECAMDTFPDYAKQLLEEAHSTLIAAFNELVSPEADAREGADSGPQAPVRAVHVYRYMRTLGLYGDVQEMVKVMRWIIRGCEDIRFLEGARAAGTKDHTFMIQMLTYFRGFAEGRVAEQDLHFFEESIEQLADEKGIPWLWPEAVDGRDDISRVEEVAERWSTVRRDASRQRPAMCDDQC